MLEQLSQALTNKFLHAPISALHGTGRSGGSAEDEAARAQLAAILARFYANPDH